MKSLDSVSITVSSGCMKSQMLVRGRDSLHGQQAHQKQIVAVLSKVPFGLFITTEEIGDSLF